jgi:hypothetical protein
VPSWLKKENYNPHKKLKIPLNRKLPPANILKQSIFLFDSVCLSYREDDKVLLDI